LPLKLSELAGHLNPGERNTLESLEFAGWLLCLEIFVNRLALKVRRKTDGTKIESMSKHPVLNASLSKLGILTGMKSDPMQKLQTSRSIDPFFDSMSSNELCFKASCGARGSADDMALTNCAMVGDSVNILECNSDECNALEFGDPPCCTSGVPNCAHTVALVTNCVRLAGSITTGDLNVS
jgi:hypothetical protein